MLVTYWFVDWRASSKVCIVCSYSYYTVVTEIWMVSVGYLYNLGWCVCLCNSHINIVWSEDCLCIKNAQKDSKGEHPRTRGELYKMVRGPDFIGLCELFKIVWNLFWVRAIRGLKHGSDMIWLIFKRITLATEVKINCKKARVEAGRPKWEMIASQSIRGLDQLGGSKSVQKSSDSGHVLKVQLTEFSDRVERKRGVKESYKILTEQLQIRN